jgi:hypothetical protein
VQPLLLWENKRVTQHVRVFVALGTQHPVRMRRIVIRGLSGCILFFQIISLTQFSNKLLNTKCVFRVSLQLLSETFFILSIAERDMIRNELWSSCKVPFILVRF